MQQFETGRARPRLATLRLIAERLDVPVEAFVSQPVPEPELPRYPAPVLHHLCERNRHDEAVAMARRLLALDPPPAPDTIAHAHLYLGRGLLAQHQPDEAIEHLQTARRHFDETGHVAMAVEAMDWEAGAWREKEDRRGLELAAAALRRYRQLDPREAAIEARLVEHLGSQLLSLHEYPRARACYEEALQVAGPLRDLTRLARIYHGLADCLEEMGDLRRAAELKMRSVALYQVENDLSPAGAGGVNLARAENDLGYLYLQQARWDRAEECISSAIERMRAAGAAAERLLADPLLNLAAVRHGQGQLDEAAELTTEAAALAEHFELAMPLAEAHELMGELHADLGEFRLAEADFERALHILEERGFDRRREECLAKYHRMHERWDAGSARKHA